MDIYLVYQRKALFHIAISKFTIHRSYISPAENFESETYVVWWLGLGAGELKCLVGSTW